MSLTYEFISSPRAIRDGDLPRINHLLKQLDPGSRVLTPAGLAAVIGGCHLLMARDEDAQGMIVGLACLACFTTLYTEHARVEDVVVDQDYRGRGIGREMMERLLAKARAEGVHEVGLTSRPARQAANALYQNMGFRRVETNVYEMALP